MSDCKLKTDLNNVINALGSNQCIQVNPQNHNTRDEGPIFCKISGSGLCTPNYRRYLKYYWMKIPDNFASFLFCFNAFGVRRFLKAVEPWIRIRILPDPDLGWFSGSRASMERLTQKFKIQKQRTCKLPRKLIQWYFWYLSQVRT